jgi:aldehyde dehydrogenase (NAD+)
VLVHEKHLKAFVEGVQDNLKTMFGEKPNGSADMGKVINDFHVERLERLIKTSGGKILCGGKVNKEVRFIEPTMILEPDMNSELMTDEIFGPILPIFPYKDIGEALKIIKKHDKPLTVYYFGITGTPMQRRLVEETSSGHFITNEIAFHFWSQY